MSQVSQFSESFFFLVDFPGTKGLTPADVLVDGFVARTFTPKDANNYFMLLLRTPASQYFLGYYGIVYHQNAWYITHNVNLVQGTSPGVPLQTTPLLDRSISATHGTIVPQRRWTPTDEVDVRCKASPSAEPETVRFDHLGHAPFPCHMSQLLVP